jgi:Domain of unknown function (DU1801)
MTVKKTKSTLHSGAADTTAAVDAFMATLEHPFKAEIAAIRCAILGVDARIAEGVKWNAPSFRTTEYFATMNLREKGGIGVILHLGARIRDVGPEVVVIADPDKMLKWLGKDRAMVVFKDMAALVAQRAAFENVLRQWITHV